MFKKLLLILFLIFSFIVPSLASPAQTIQQEQALIEYIASAMQKYIQSVDWFQNKNYTEEIKKVQAIALRYGYKQEECFVALIGTEAKNKQVIPVGVAVIITGKADPVNKPYWKIIFSLRPTINPNKQIPEQKRYGI